MSRPFPLLSTADAIDDDAVGSALEDFELAVQALIDQDPMAHGRFSRAYVTAIFHACLAPREPGVGSASPCGRPDPHIAQALKRWIQGQLQRHAAEAGDARLTAARRAAHGLWLQSLAMPLDDDGGPRAARLLDGLLALTRPE